MKKKIPAPDEPGAFVPQAGSCRAPEKLTAAPADEIYAEYLSGGICRHLKPAFFLSLQQTDGGALPEVCLFASSGPARYRLTDCEDPYHCNDFTELICVLRGQLSLTIERQTQIFSEHELCLIRPSVFYQENRAQSHAVTLSLCIRADYLDETLRPAASADSMQGFLMQSLRRESGMRQFLRFSSASGSEQETQNILLSFILKEYKAKQPGWEAILQGLLIRLMAFLATGYPFTFSDSEKKEYRRYLFREVEQYLEQNYSDMQMNDLSERFHYQTNYFNRLIHEFTGKSYSEYLISIRLRIARELLEQTDDGIEEIMHAIGYNNKGFFYRMFREEYGMTPAAYRRKARAEKA